MCNAFLTGSRVYGTPREDSDLDFVVLVTPDTINQMREFLGDYEHHGDPRYLGQPCSASIRFGDLNIIATTDEATFNAWKQSTEILAGRKPVTRDAAGRDKSTKRFDVDFGATMPCGKEHGWSLSYLYPPFLDQAKRVLKPEGLLLAKITDMVNSHRSRWAHCDFMRMAEDAGFTVCDLIVKVRKGPMISTKWQKAHHARKRHCFWIICRNSESCQRKANP